MALLSCLPESYVTFNNICFIINTFQRQTLRGVPVTEVKYKWDDVTTRYWVYGNERKVYAPDYPHQCCCGCEIL
jgi:hypothetical protein